MPAKTLMVQGTASHVGKSLLTAALCRLFVRRGLRVAPFKAQNMSNNSFVTMDGQEIGRAQAVQATACRVPPHVDFNPVLLKPASPCSSQLIVNGAVAGTLSANDFGRVRRECSETIHAAFDRLRARFDLIVLEGAGSPAEINLREQDVVNMSMARHARSPVLLVGDIDRGGVFASLFGTWALLDADERRYLRGFIINKFRGDLSLLTPGLHMLTERTGLSCLGMIPHRDALAIPEEDSLGWRACLNEGGMPRRHDSEGAQQLVIGVADLPYLSNFTDLEALAREPDVQMLQLSSATERYLDALILPGTKSTIEGLRFLKQHGLAALAHQVVNRGGTVVGLCGGYQMLGRRILDPSGVESAEVEHDGLGLLDAITVFLREKVTVQVSGSHRQSGSAVDGYEVHMGRTDVNKTEPLLDIRSGPAAPVRPEGATRSDGLVFGTYVHGLFDSAPFRRWFLNRLRAARGWLPVTGSSPQSLDDDLDRLADFVEEHLNLAAIEHLIHEGIPEEV